MMEANLNKSPAHDLVKVLWYYNMLPDLKSSISKILCPFHEDANPSMLINLEQGTWFCFGCQKSGDAKKFVRYMEKNLNDLQALQKFHKILKSKKCSEVNVKHFIKRSKPPSRELYAQAYDYYHGLRRVDWLTDTQDEVEEAYLYMRGRGFSATTLNKVGAKVTYNKSYGLIFPMLDNGKFKGWVCRTMVREVEKKRKYLYNEGFSRASTIVGDYGECDYIFIVEGYMDRLKFIQFGCTNVIAILGWKISSEQIEKLKKAGIVSVISALDNDKCGRDGTEYLKKFFNVTRFCYLKGVKDPGETDRCTFDKMFRRTMWRFQQKVDGGKQ